jgi:hypothetical protein
VTHRLSNIATNDTSRDELTIEELDAVSGGGGAHFNNAELVVTDGGGGGGGIGTTPAGAWNACLNALGYPAQAHV